MFFAISDLCLLMPRRGRNKARLNFTFCASAGNRGISAQFRGKELYENCVYTEAVSIHLIPLSQ